MAQSGRIKDIKDGGGNIIDKAGNDIPFLARYLDQQCLNVGDMVRFNRVTVNGQDVCVDVKRLTIGTIASINPDNCSGTILEKEPNPKKFSGGKPVPVEFYEPLLKERGYMVGDFVHYELLSVPDKSGSPDGVPTTTTTSTATATDGTASAATAMKTIAVNVEEN